MSDETAIYRETPFKGRSLLSLSVAIWTFLFCLPALLGYQTDSHDTFELVRVCAAIPLVFFYFFGFWKAVIDKGYSKVLFLSSFIPLLGLLLIFYLPKVNPEN